MKNFGLRTSALGLAMAAVIATGSGAQADSVGVYAPLLGVEYQFYLDANNGLRLGVGLPLGSLDRSFGALLLSGDVSHLYRLTSGGT